MARLLTLTLTLTLALSLITALPAYGSQSFLIHESEGLNYMPSTDGETVTWVESPLWVPDTPLGTYTTVGRRSIHTSNLKDGWESQSYYSGIQYGQIGIPPITFESAITPMLSDGKAYWLASTEPMAISAPTGMILSFPQPTPVTRMNPPASGYSLFSNEVVAPSPIPTPGVITFPPKGLPSFPVEQTWAQPYITDNPRFIDAGDNLYMTSGTDTLINVADQSQVVLPDGSFPYPTAFAPVPPIPRDIVDVEGDWVLWKQESIIFSDPLGPSYGLWNMQTQEEKILPFGFQPSRSSPQQLSRITDDKVIWCQRLFNGLDPNEDVTELPGQEFSLNILAYDFLTDETTVLYQLETVQGPYYSIFGDPAVSSISNTLQVDGDYVVWNLLGKIMAHQFSTGETFTVSDSDTLKMDLFFANGLAVWTEDGEGYNTRIMGAYIPEPASLALLAFGGLPLLRRRK